MSKTIDTVTETAVAGFPTLTGMPAHPDPGRPPIVLLHGAFADHHCFRPWVTSLAEHGYRAYAPARRGRVGIGPAHARGLDFDDYLDDALAVISAVDQPPIVVGHSLGALLAQCVAERSAAAAIVLLAPAPPAMLTAQLIAVPKFVPQLPRIMTGRPFIVGRNACSVLALNRVPADRRAAVHARLTHESGKVYRAMMLGAIKVDASKVTVPVYVASGRHDRIVSPRLAHQTAAHYGVDATIYPEHGHWILDEPGSEQVLDDILRWVEAQPLLTPEP